MTTDPALTRTIAMTVVRQTTRPMGLTCGRKASRHVRTMTDSEIGLAAGGVIWTVQDRERR